MVPEGKHSNIFFTGGAQKRVYQLAVHFASLGQDIFLGSDDRTNALIIRDLINRGVKFIPLKFRGNLLQNVFCVYKLYKIARQKKIDIIHCNDRKTAIFAFLVSKVLKIKMVYTARSAFTDKKFTRFFWGKNIIAVSYGVKENLINSFKIKAERITVIYNGGEINMPSPEEIKEIREEYHLSENKRVIVFVGRLKKEKGLFYLLDAIKLVAHVFPEIVLLIVGDGKLRADLEKRTNELSLNNNILFCGYQKNVEAYYGVAEFTILPSLWEGLPGSAIESIMLGKTVISTDVGGIPEIIQDGINGYIVPPKDSELLAKKIIEMLSNTQIIKYMSRECIRIAHAKFTLSKMMENYNNYYRRLIK